MITIRLKNDGFHVSSGLFTPNKAIIDAVVKHSNALIEKQINKDKQKRSGEGVYILGNFIPFKDGFVNINGKIFLYKDERNYSLILKKIFTGYLEDRTHYYEKIMGITTPYKVSINKKATNRGCNSKQTNRITYNTDLLQYSLDIIDSVIIHELAHHFYRDHSENFYNVVEKYCPNYWELHKKLNKGIFKWLKQLQVKKIH